MNKNVTIKVDLDDGTHVGVGILTEDKHPQAVGVSGVVQEDIMLDLEGFCLLMNRLRELEAWLIKEELLTFEEGPESGEDQVH